jgi:hypothetical protein
VKILRVYTYHSPLLILLHDLEHQESQSVCNWLLYQTRRQTLRPSALPEQLLQLEQDQMITEFVLLLQALRLKTSPDDLEGVRECSGHNPRNDSREKFVLPHGLELLIEHVVEPTKGALLYTAGQSSTEKTVQALLLVDIRRCRMD